MIWIAAGPCLVLGVLWLWALRRERAAERRIAAVAGASRDLLWAVDGEGRWTYVNGAAAEIYGLAPEQMIGRSLAEFAVADCVEMDRRFVQDALSSSECVHHETDHLREDGNGVRLAFSGVSCGNGAVGSATDVTHLRDLERRLVKTERMHAIGALAGGVAHDFKNLLTVMIGQAEITKAHASAEVTRRMDTILGAAARGRDMVEELLVFARKQNQRHEMLDLCEVVRGMTGLIERLLVRDVTLKLRLRHGPVWVRADRGKIEQVIMNLVVNARDASPDGGRIAIRVDRGKLDLARTRVLGIEPGYWAVLQVIDRGAGMSEEVLAQVFEPFYTTKEEGRGTGLGLATVHGVVHQYGGTVAARSAPGRGTLMSVLLPIIPGRKANEEAMNPADRLQTPSGP